MAGRPFKEGLDYFPLNINIDQDDKISYLEAKYGLNAFGLLIKLYLKIYREGYYTFWNEKIALMFAKSNNIDINVCNNLISDYINENLFNRNIYEKYGILTSVGIQKRYFEITRRREKVKIIPEIILIDISEYNNLISVDNNSIFVNNLPTKIPKEKKSKLKEKESYGFTSNHSITNNNISLDKDNITIDKNLAKKQTNPEIKVFLDWYCDQYQSRFNKKYIVSGAKEGSIIKRLLSYIKIDNLKELAINFFEAEDDFMKQSGYTVGVFSSVINKLQITNGKIIPKKDKVKLIDRYQKMIEDAEKEDLERERR